MADEEKTQDTPQPSDPQARLTELETQLAVRDQRITELETNIAASIKETAAVRTSLSQAVASYKTLLAQANPEVLVELIAGDSIEAINQSLQAAKDLVGRVKKTIVAAAAATRVPAGAPQRVKPDVSALSAREKIHYGLGK